MNPQDTLSFSALLTFLIGVAWTLFRKSITRNTVRQVARMLDAASETISPVTPALMGNGTTALIQSAGVSWTLAQEVTELKTQMGAQLKRITDLEERVIIRDARIEYLTKENLRIPGLEERVRSLEKQVIDRDDTIARLTKRIVELEQKERNHETHSQTDSHPPAGAAHPE